MSLPVDWTGADAAQLAAGTIRPGVVLRINTYPYRIRLWSGVGDLRIAMDTIEDYLPVGAPYDLNYKGIGALAGIPAVNQLINGLAERADFTLSAVDMPAEIAAIAGTEAADIRSVPVHLGVVVFDAQWQQIASTLWLWQGVADSLKVERTNGADGEVIRSIVLSVASTFSGRRRPQNSYWTDPDQRRRSSTDDFFDRVDLYSQGSTMVWPT